MLRKILPKNHQRVGTIPNDANNALSIKLFDNANCFQKCFLFKVIAYYTAESMNIDIIVSQNKKQLFSCKISNK